MLGWVRKVFGGGATAARSKPADDRRQARLDIARTDETNSKHWAYADGAGPNLGYPPGDRQLARQRAVYEFENNCYALGLVMTLANTFVGPTGPRLQVMTPDAEVNRQVEEAFAGWAKAVRLKNKLWTAKVCKTVQGEALALKVTNEKLPTSVKLDLRLLEADQLSAPLGLWMTPRHVDGIDFDEAGNPTTYHVLKEHPRDLVQVLPEWTPVPARNVLHWFRQTRPGQRRGYTELAPALPLFAPLRRFGAATLDAAETAACFAGVLKSTLPPNTANEDEEDGEVQAKWWSRVEIVRRMLLTLPENYELQQLKAEHPGTTHEMFIRAVVREIARCLGVPLTLALLDSSFANFSSSRLDISNYRDDVDVQREDCEAEFLEPTFDSWLDEATRIPKHLPANLPAVAASLPHQWHWPPWAYLDPLKDAQSITEQLLNGSLTVHRLAAQQGIGWQQLIDEQLEAEAYEQQRRRDLGLPPKTPPTRSNVQSGQQTDNAQPAGELAHAA